MTQNYVVNKDALRNEYTELARIQASVNTSLVGDTWITRALSQREDAKAGRMPLDYATAALDESLELFRSVVPFKWWAPAYLPDVNNGLVELVDILHFGLSYEIVTEYEVRRDTCGPNGHVNLDDVYVLAAQCITCACGSVDRARVARGAPYSVSDLVLLRESVMNLMSGLAAGVFEWNSFWKVVYQLGSNPTEIAGLYRAKAELNKFRKDNGYKEGTYKKMWRLQGDLTMQEDNAVVMRFVEAYTSTQNKAPSAAELQTFMTQAYNGPFNVDPALPAGVESSYT